MQRLPIGQQKRNRSAFGRITPRGGQFANKKSGPVPRTGPLFSCLAIVRAQFNSTGASVW